MNAVLPYLKTYCALVGSICTALLGVFTADTQVGKILTVVSVIATAVVTFAVPNLDPKALHQEESVQPPNQRGEAYLGLIVGVLLVVILVVVLLRLV